RLAHAGVRLDWKVDPEAQSPSLSAEQVLHTLRIVQEAVTNALKHASPSVLRVTFRADPDKRTWALCVEDGGVGFGARSGNFRGDGLKNMRTRAAQAGLELSIDSVDTGTTVRIGGTSSAGFSGAPRVSTMEPVQ